MEKSYNDLMTVIILTILSFVWLMIPTLNLYPQNIIVFTLTLLILPGYSLLATLKPLCYYESITMRLLYSAILGFLISISTFMILNFTKLHNIHTTTMIIFITIVLSIVAIIRRIFIENPDLNNDDNKELTSKQISVGNYTDQDIVIVENVGMEFNLSQEKVDNLKEYVIKLLKRELFYQPFWALKDVSFSVEKGDKLGIVGLNGAGKSTLLKLISGVMKPTEGNVHTKGRIVPLLELGAGFDHNYTGKENIFLNGALLGYPKTFLEEKYEEIVEFSEIGDFIDVPLKNYSSGMIARLGFSIATVVEPEILILDEILSVGDVKFQEKSQKRMKSLLNKDVTVLFVSHSIEQVKSLCNKAIWLEKGKVVMQGTAEEVCNKYLESIHNPPYITSTNPINHAANVAPDKTITLTFNEAIKVGTNCIELKNSEGSHVTITKSINDNTLLVKPDANLKDSFYTFIIHTGAVTNQSDIPVAPIVLYFSVRTSTVTNDEEHDL